VNYFGDSGSWVLRQSDNALVGLLWGLVDGHLLFTPIKDVFSDIKSVLNARGIRLPGAPDSSQSSSLLRYQPRLSNEHSQTRRAFFRPFRLTNDKKHPATVLRKGQPQTPDPVQVATDATRSQTPDSPSPGSYYSVPSPIGTSTSVSSPPDLSTSSPSPPATPREQHEFEGEHISNTLEPAILTSDCEDCENEIRPSAILESKASVEKLPDNKRVTENAITKTSLDYICNPGASPCKH